MSSDNRQNLDVIYNRDDYINLSYIPKLYRLGSAVSYPLGMNITYVNTNPYTNLDDIDFETVSPYQTDFKHVKSDGNRRQPSYIQKQSLVQYNESRLQKSNARSVTATVLRKANILTERNLWYGDKYGNVGFENNPFTLKNKVLTFKKVQDLYSAIITAFTSLSSVLYTDTNNRFIVLTESGKTSLLNPSGNSLETANYYTRLVNELLGGDANRIIVIPDFIFTAGSKFFAIVESSLIKFHFTGIPSIYESGTDKIYNYWFFQYFSTMVELMEKGACSIYPYTLPVTFFDDEVSKDIQESINHLIEDQEEDKKKNDSISPYTQEANDIDIDTKENKKNTSKK